MSPTPPEQSDLSGHDGNIDLDDQVAGVKVNTSVEELDTDDIVKVSLSQSNCKRVEDFC